MGTSSWREEKRNGRKKGNFSGGVGEMRSIQNKGVGVGVGRCVLWRGGPMLFSSWIKWLNIVIVPIDISIHIPYPVATLGRYFTTLVWHPWPARRPPFTVA